MYENMKELREKVAHLYGGENETIAPPVQTTKGIPQILVLRGNNHEMGRQYGEKLAFKIHALITVLKAALYQTNGEERKPQLKISRRRLSWQINTIPPSESGVRA